MKLKTALFLVFALTFQPTFAVSDSSWSEDALTWTTLGVALAGASYFANGKLKEGLKVVVPAVVGSSVFAGLVAANVVLKRFDRFSVGTVLSVILIGSVLVYKSMLTCPIKGTPGCTCGIK